MALPTSAAANAAAEIVKAGVSQGTIALYGAVKHNSPEDGAKADAAYLTALLTALRQNLEANV